jgi:hypothetical protein
MGESTENIPHDMSAVANAIKARREHLDALYRRDGEAYRRSGLIGMQRVIFLLAVRYIGASPLHQQFTDDHEIQWYSDYLEAGVAIAATLQQAIKAGALTLRSSRTRTEIPSPQSNDWIALDVRGAVMAARPFSASMTYDVHASEWPDLCWCGHLGWGFDQNELADWVRKSGIANAEEFESLMACPRIETSSCDGAEHNVRPVGDAAITHPEAIRTPQWVGDLLREADEYHRAEQLRNGVPTKMAVARHLAKFAKEQDIRTEGHGINPSQDTIYKHALAGWVRPSD